MHALVILFLVAAMAVWLSVFGYWFALQMLARRGRPGGAAGESPAVAVIIPVLNEAALIAAKLADIRRTDYPQERLDVWVVDGGSSDGTAEVVERAIAAGQRLHLLRPSDVSSRADQIARALEQVREEVVIVTDADAVLEPSCVRELVAALGRDPRTAVVGATVRPASALLEERVHWWLINHLWWLEGEALSASLVSGVCYAVRRSAVSLPLAPGRADDAQLALRTSARGLRVRLCPTALATEVRVPQTAAQVLGYRRRRGGDYMRELRRARPAAGAPLAWRVVRGMRLWHFLVTPKAGLALAVVGFALLWTEHWPWALAAFVAFAAPALAFVARGAVEESDRNGWWDIGVAATRLVGLTWLAMLTLPRYTAASD